MSEKTTTSNLVTIHNDDDKHKSTKTCPAKRKPSFIVLNEDEVKEMYNNPNKVPAKSKVARTHLLKRTLEKDKEYAYCTCGFAGESQPFCDDTCVNSGDKIQGWRPVRFQVTVNQTFWALCGCKRNKSGNPFCDGSHIDIDIEDL